MLRVPVSPLQLGLLTLDKPTSHYLVQVHRARPGTEFVAFDPQSALQAQATVVLASPKAATCRVARIVAADVPSHALTIVQAFSKGARIDQVVRDATALDVTEIRVVATQNSALPGPHEVQGRLARWRKIAIEAARQCGRGDVPRIEGVLSLSAVLDDLRLAGGARVVLSPTASLALWDALGDDGVTRAALLIGPEGGLTQSERELAIGHGFVEARLGPRVLRTELATAVTLSVVQARWGFGAKR